MPVFYRLGLTALIVLVSVPPVRGQERRVERDTILIERRVSPERTHLFLRHTGPDGHTRVLTGDSARAWMRARGPVALRALNGSAGMVTLDSLRAGRRAFRVQMDALVDGRSRLRLDTLLERRLSSHLRLRRHREDGDVRVYRFDGPPGQTMDGPAMRLRRPDARLRRMAPRMGGGMIVERDVLRREGDSTVITERRMAPRRTPGRPLLERRPRGDSGIARDGGHVRIERNGEGRVRVYRFGGEAERMAPRGLRIEGRPPSEERVIRLNRDGQVVEGEDLNVRVERDADGGLRIYIPPAQKDGDAPAPRSRRN